MALAEPVQWTMIGLIPLAMFAALQRLPGLDMPANLVARAPGKAVVLATVNGKPITAEEMEPLLWDWRMTDVLSDLIADRVVRDAAGRAKIKVEDSEVAVEVKKLLEAIKASLPQGQSMEEAMAKEGTTPSRIWLRMRSEILLRRLALAELKPESYVSVSTIIIKPASEQASDLKAALDKAEDCYKRLTVGESWERVFLAVSEDARARATLGKIGWRILTAFPEVAAKEIAGLGRGKITKAVQTVNGIQIFRVDAKGADVTGDERTELEDAYFASRRNGLMTKLREEAGVKLGG